MQDTDDIVGIRWSFDEAAQPPTERGAVLAPLLHSLCYALARDVVRGPSPLEADRLFTQLGPLREGYGIRSGSHHGRSRIGRIKAISGFFSDVNAPKAV